MRALVATHATFDQHVPRLRTGGLDDVVVALGNELESAITSEFNNPQVQQSMTDFLTEVHDRLDASVRPNRRAVPDVRALLEDLTTRYAVAVAVPDSEPFREVFDLAMTISALSYEDANAMPTGTTPAQTTFQTTFTPGSPHDFNCRFALGGETETKRSPREVCALVQLPDVRNFSWESSLAAPYVLLHECLSHAFQGGDDAPDRYSTFAEGWMDVIVLLVLKRAIDGRPPFQAITLQIAEAPRSLAIADEFHRARLDYWRDEGGAHRAIGASAARALHATLGQRLTPDDADRLLVRFSLALNASDVEPERRDELARRLERALPKPEQKLATVIPPAKLIFLSRARKLLDDFAITGNLSQTVEGLILASVDV